MVVALLVLPRFDIKIPAVALVLIMVGWFVMSAFLYVVGIRALDRKPIDGPDSIIGKKGIVVQALNPKGQVKISGSCGAESDENIDTGEEIIVTGHSGIKLMVVRCDNSISGELE